MKDKEFIYVAVGIDVLAMLFGGLRLFGQLPVFVSQFQTPLSIFGSWIFVLFLKRLGEYVKESDVVDRAESVLRIGYVLAGTWALMRGLVLIAGRGGVGTVLVLTFAMLAIGLIGAIRYGGLLNSARYAVLEAD